MELEGPLHAHTVNHDAPTQADINAFRTLGADMASGVGIVSTVHRRRDNAATVSGFLSVSYDPPTIVISLYEQSRICEAVTGSGTWALSLLTTEQQGTANWLASPGNPVEGLLSQVPFCRAPTTGAAVMSGALAWFELKTVAVHEAATHLLIVGEVMAMGRDVPGSAANDPMIHFAGEYEQLRR
ncbi:flavin reductase family protein [Arthrobacter roseus]|uniref:flavin reductase family protein n=1 Tax=Arthrobacter roseus TaxID=136274 RepID=UPI0019627282|nr:flavin reductase family protein [Arthrobacter roseus]MBM7846852.1 flavin reductase (DIM6/NTAB) family NADH-FMN oxidoreductase RutF [Arthrobacter roseus]